MKIFFAKVMIEADMNCLTDLGIAFEIRDRIAKASYGVIKTGVGLSFRVISVKDIHNKDVMGIKLYE